ncbi:MAG: dihydrofolate reductase [Candidatus Peribacteraceae bacterium]|nr:dihydrofolate reductase [Candidatus Peribacteraceae bacterium]
MIISMIVAADENNCIGAGNKLLWSLPDDMKHFRELTKGHPVIMGRKTHESIGKVLPGRRNIVISHRKDLKIDGCDIVDSLDRAIELVKDDPSGEAFIIGGGEIYRQAMERADRIYLTRVDGEFTGDTFFPEIDEERWREVSREEHPADERHQYSFSFILYTRV